MLGSALFCAFVVLATWTTGALDDHLEPQEFQSGAELKAALGSYEVVAEGEGSVFNPCYADSTSDECEAYKATRRTADEPKRADYAEALSTNAKQTAIDVQDYSDIISIFEHRTNDWGCAVTGKPLYTVSGDRDVMNYIYYFLSQVFDYNGQNYAARLVTSFHEHRENGNIMFNCDVIAMGNEQHFAAPIDAVLTLREMMTAWLRKNEVKPKPIVNGFFPQARKLYGKFLRSRMLFANTTTSTSEAAISAILPIIERTDHVEFCEAGAEFASIASHPRSVKFSALLDEMLQSCVDNGKLAKNPAEYGEVLLNAGREKDARRLFNLAVERGILCNAWQRPESLHRKDLPAAAIWPTHKVRGVKAAFDRLSGILRVRASHGRFDSLSERGDFTRIPLFSRQGVNTTLCDAVGDPECAEVSRAAQVIIGANDGYQIACNGSLTIELWKIKRATTVPRDVGATNIVLQAVLPLNEQPLTLQVGEESIQLDLTFSDPVVFDNSFEHTLILEGSKDGYFLHAQVCHPGMHDKVLDIPSQECAEFEDED